MKTSTLLSYVAFVGIICAAGGPGCQAKTSETLLLEKAEPRLRAIYDQGEFRPQRFRGDWLSDSSGYTVRESVAGSDEKVRVKYECATGTRTVLDASEAKETGRRRNLSPDGSRVISSDRGNLVVQDLTSDEKTPLTHDAPDSTISNGQGVWSPDGERIAFVQTDRSGVRTRSMILPGDPSYPEVREMSFARVGGVISKLRVGVVDAQGKETRWVSIPLPAEGFYLGQVSWAGNSDELLIEQLSRFRDKREFWVANVRTGQITCIFRETDPAWVVASYGKNSGLEWIRNGQAFIVLTEKDGWRHAYVYSRKGKELALLTPGDFDIIERARIDEAGGWFYYYASPGNGAQKYLFRVRLDGAAKPERVTPMDQSGTHDYDFSPDAKWAFHTVSNFDTPPVTQLVRLNDHRAVRVLEDNQSLRDKMETLISQPTEFFRVTVGDGVEVDGWMIKPKGFDPSKKYPVFIYVYGEPHGQTVLDAWARSQADFHRVIADLGYLVVTMDNRGTPAPKGAAWRRSIFGSLGPLSTEEQAAAIQALGRARTYVDLSRVGIWGWSGGGSNTLNAMFRKPEVYHVGIAVAPKPQPHLYNAWFQEIYMETRESNPEGYEQSAPINFAEGLKGDLMILHGTGETNTHVQITEGLVDRLIELGKQFDYMAYPHRNHGLSEGKGTTVHVRMLIARYLLEHLPPGPR
ncbi:MAG: prolyl oligopeptidase family serine peptidase [Planctomycetes bacterium]|nr:prolyl oligopeptidase family serine peptidase [Planctomycetota bacterium]